MATTPVSQSGTFNLGGDAGSTASVTARCSSPARACGARPLTPEAIRVLRRAVELGVNFIDTADSYGPDVSEELIREALHPYPEDLVIATKAGLTRTGPERLAAGRPAGVPAPAVRADACGGSAWSRSSCSSCTASTRRCRWPSARRTGGSSSRRARSATSGCPRCRSTSSLEAQRTATIATVQNLYNLANRSAEDAAGPLRAETASASSRGSRWRPASSPSRAARSTRSPASTARRPRSSRWRGCCAARR